MIMVNDMTAEVKTIGHDHLSNKQVRTTTLNTTKTSISLQKQLMVLTHQNLRGAL